MGLLGPLLPADVPARVGRGRARLCLARRRGARHALVVGGLAPGGGPAFYFVRDVADDLAGGRAASHRDARRRRGRSSLVALVAARTLARGILAPIEEAGRDRRTDRTWRPACPGAGRHRTTSSGRGPTGSTGWPTRSPSRSVGWSSAQHQNRRFVADVSHELRTPVTALVAEASILRRAPRRRCRPTRGGPRELLVNDTGRLRDSRRGAHGAVALRRRRRGGRRLEKVDLGKLIETVRAARSPQAHVPGRPRSRSSSTPTPAALADPRRILDNERRARGGCRRRDHDTRVRD